MARAHDLLRIMSVAVVTVVMLVMQKYVVLTSGDTCGL